MQPTLILRIALAVVLLTHSIPVMLNGGVNEFGVNYLAPLGFGALGLPLAWAIKLSHVLCAILLLLNRYVFWAGVVTILILVMGIVLIHGREGWFVVGNGRNGAEYSVVLISVLVYLMVVNRTRK